jgi:hypothetical protein
MNELTALIDQTTDTILDTWTRSAALAGIDAEEFISLKLDEMAVTDWDACKALSARHLRRILAADGIVVA